MANKNVILKDGADTLYPVTLAENVQGYVQPTGSVTTTFTLPEDIEDWITTPDNPIVYGYFNISSYPRKEKPILNSITASSTSWRDTSSSLTYTSQVITSVSIGGTTYYGFKANYAGFGFYTASLSDVTIDATKLKIIKYSYTSNTIVTENYYVPRYTGSHSSWAWHYYQIPATVNDILLLAQITQV